MAERPDDNDADIHDDTYGMALGFRIIEEDGGLYLVEAEIAPYVDEPQDLGVSLVFHPLDGVNPAEETDDEEWPAWQIDVDDDLTRQEGSSITDQFQKIAQQLREFSEDDLRKYLRAARE
ncbi:MAG TPA: hypothetical protein VFI91_03385 [Longimicrobiaceae bacterium]|nr:hypothetical protein [Longimicrobiaceae bacterium]